MIFRTLSYLNKAEWLIRLDQGAFWIFKYFNIRYMYYELTLSGKQHLACLGSTVDLSSLKLKPAYKEYVSSPISIIW
jgi:hypothetical protein